MCVFGVRIEGEKRKGALLRHPRGVAEVEGVRDHRIEIVGAEFPGVRWAATAKAREAVRVEEKGLYLLRGSVFESGIVSMRAGDRRGIGVLENGERCEYHGCRRHRRRGDPAWSDPRRLIPAALGGYFGPDAAAEPRQSVGRRRCFQGLAEAFERLLFVFAVAVSVISALEVVVAVIPHQQGIRRF